MYDRASIPKPAQLSAKTGYEPRHMAAIRDAYGLDRATPELWAEVGAVYYGKSRSRSPYVVLAAAAASPSIHHWQRIKHWTRLRLSYNY